MLHENASAPATRNGSPLEGIPCVRAIAPYQPGLPIEEVARLHGLDPTRIVKLASNENPLGMSPRAREAIVAALDDLERYPDGNGTHFKQAVSERFGVPVDGITLGNGSNEVLEMVVRALCPPGASSVVFARYAFAVYPLATQAAGARGIVVPSAGLGHDLEAMCAAIEPDTRVVFVANPNNPTGTFLPQEQLLAFLEQVPAGVAVVLDEAYGEYLDASTRYDPVPWLARFPNLILSRTLSKAYGLAGLRIGYLLASAALTDLFNRVRNPFNVNALALAAGVAALQDEAFVARTAEVNRAGLRQLQQGFARLGLAFEPSYANFVLVRVGPAAAVFEALLRVGVIVRPVAGYGLPEWLRISVGLPEENARLLLELERALAACAGHPTP